MNKVTIPRESIQQSIRFGVSFASAEYQKSSRDFGSKHVEKRSNTDKTVDTISGKLGEFAFKDFCNQNGLNIEIDLSLKRGYREIDDGQDIVRVGGIAPNLKFDIKESKKYAQWLLVESHKLSKEIIFADVYIFVRLDLPKGIEKNLNLFDLNVVNAEISGYAYKEDFFDAEGNAWFDYKEGSRLLKQKVATKFFLADDLDFRNYKKSFLAKEYNKIKSSGDDIFINISLKAEQNFGLPIGMLRNTKDDYEELFKVLSNKDVQVEHIIDRYRRLYKYS